MVDFYKYKELYQVWVRGRGGAGRIRRTSPDQVRGSGRVIGAVHFCSYLVIGPISRQDGPENHPNHKLRRAILPMYLD